MKDADRQQPDVPSMATDDLLRTLLARSLAQPVKQQAHLVKPDIAVHAAPDSQMPIAVDDQVATLWSINITKMHFQQNACFQLRNWAVGITGILVPLIWTGSATLPIKLLLHIFAILLMILILHKDLSWHTYFYVYRDRSRLCEACMLREIDVEKLTQGYRAIVMPSKSQLLKSALSIKRLLLLQADYIEVDLILLLILSLVATVVFT